MDENCTVDWWSFTELGDESAGPTACSCEECVAKFRMLRAAGLMPPVEADVDAWWEGREAACQHDEEVPSRERRRRERAKRRSSRLDGRWHRRVNQQRDRQRRFEREAKQALDRSEEYTPPEPSREEMEASVKSFREWQAEAEEQGDLFMADYWREEVVSTALLSGV